MDMYTATEIGKAWSALGSAQQDQALALMMDTDIDNLIYEGQLNPNALRDIKDYLRTLVAFDSDEAETLLDEIETWERQRDEALS